MNYSREEKEETSRSKSEREMLRSGCIGALIYLAAFAVGLCICAMMGSCAASRTAVATARLNYDSTAVNRQVAEAVSSWQMRTDSAMQQTLDIYAGWLASTQRQYETVTELVTTAYDSLGRECRTEQRTTTRDITASRQQGETRQQQETATAVSSQIARQDSIWWARLDSVSAAIARHDSLYAARNSAGSDSRPWWQRLWSKCRDLLLGLAVGFAVWATRRLWTPLLQRI